MPLRMQRAASFTVLALFGLLSAGTGLAQQEAKKAVIAAPVARVDPAQADFTLDLRPLVQEEQLKDGWNLITTTFRGLRVYLRAERGRVTGVQVKDNEGHTLQLIPVQQPAPATRPAGLAAGQTSRSTAATDKNIRCWHCYEKNGEYHCFEIKCPWDTGGALTARPAIQP